MLCSATASCCDQSILPVFESSTHSLISCLTSASTYSLSCSGNGGPIKNAPASAGSSSPVGPPTTHLILPSVRNSTAVSLLYGLYNDICESKLLKTPRRI